MEISSIEPRPEIRGPLVSLLTQWYVGADEPTVGIDVDLPDAMAALTDLVLMFLLYVKESQEEFAGAELGAVISLARMFAEYARETEKARGGDFREFLQRQALAVYEPGDQQPDETL